ncbi:MAG: hypothetical protein ISS76_20875 [Phycisphaerae bacterium]|nr:hypothetical protein [Phycisphaerae bacterium]
MSLEHELKSVKYAVCKAAEAIMQITREGFKTDRKADNSPITIADLEANRILHETLTGSFSNYGWLSEETRDDPRRLECERVWIVDPIDGTREFTMQIPEFAISVALAERGEVILGVICNPSTGELFEAIRDGGTMLNDQWRHVVCRRRGQTLALWVDGTAHDTRSNSDYAMNLFPGAWNSRAIGQVYDTGQYDWPFAMADLRAYDRAITEEEITAMSE